MVQLIVLACLIANPNHCETFSIPFQSDMNLNQCLWQSQVHAAEWSADHPDWLVRKFNCGLPPT